MSELGAQRDARIAQALASALTAIEQERWREAVQQLVAAWQDCRCARIARAVAAADARLPAPAPLDGDTVHRREVHWHELVKQGDDDGLRRALAAPWPAYSSQAFERLGTLGRIAISPRTSNALLALHRQGRYDSNTGAKLSREIFRYLIECGDHAVADELARLEGAPDSRRRLGTAVFRRIRPEAPAWSADVEAALARIEALLVPEERAGAPTRDALLAAVYAAPFDDGPRAVLADVLTEAGDPRGELIVLQLQRHRGEGTRKGLARERQLLKLGNQWYDGLDVDGATDIVLERGFPVSAKLGAGEIRAPGWATIESLVLTPAHVFRGSSHLRALRKLYNLASRDLATAAVHDPELDFLSVVDFHVGLDVETSLAPRSIGFVNPHDLATMLEVAAQLHRRAIGRRVETMRLGHSIRGLELVMRHREYLRDLAIELAGWSRLETPVGWTARVTRDALRFDWWGPSAYVDVAFESIVPVVQQLAAPRFEVLEVHGVAHVATGKVRDALLHVVEPWKSLREVTIFGRSRGAGN